MTVSSSVAKAGPYVGNGSTKIFAYTFRILDDAHVLVTRQLLDGTIENVDPSEYVVDGIGNASGNITFTTAPSSGQKLTIIRNVPLTQDLDLENEGPYLAEDIEASFDKALMIDQQQQEIIERAIHAPAGDTATSMELPAVAARAGRTLIFDASGNPAAGELTTEGVSAIAASVAADKLAAEAAVTAATVQASSAEDSAVDAAAQAAAAAQSLASITDVVLAASPTVATFVGDGVQTSFNLTVEDPPAESMFVYFDGVYQAKTGVYSVSGYSLNFVSPPGNGVDIEVITGGFTTIATTTIGGVAGLQTALDAKLDLTGGTLSGAVKVPNGTNTLPAVARSADPSTGFFFGASMVSFSAAGVETMRLDGSSLRLGLPAGQAVESNTPQVQAHDTDADAGFAAFRWSGDAGGPSIITAKGRAATPGTMTAVQSGDVIGTWTGLGADGTTMQPGARVIMRVDGSPGAADMPGSIELWTSPDGSAAPQHRFRVAADGTVMITEGETFASQVVGGVRPRLQTLGGNTNAVSHMMGSFMASTVGPNIFALKSRNTTVGSHTIVQSGDTLFQIVGYGSDGANWVAGAQIIMQVAGTPGTNDMPGRISFRTTADGASSTTEHVTIEPDGEVQIKSTARLRLLATGDAGLASTGHALQIGTTASTNLIIDPNEIQARNNGVAGTLTLNGNGGTVSCGSALTAAGKITTNSGGLEVNGSTSTWYIGSNGYQMFFQRAGLNSIVADNAAGGLNLYTGGVTTDGAVEMTSAGAVSFARIGTTASAANAFLSTGGNILRSTSIMAAKREITQLDDADVAKALALRPVRFKSALEVDDPDQVQYGFIAEWMAEDAPELAVYDDELERDEETGERRKKVGGTRTVQGVAYERVAALLTALVQKQQTLIEDLTARIEALEGAP